MNEFYNPAMPLRLQLLSRKQKNTDYKQYREKWRRGDSRSEAHLRRVEPPRADASHLRGFSFPPTKGTH